jgi:hypothetical protein
VKESNSSEGERLRAGVPKFLPGEREQAITFRARLSVFRGERSVVLSQSGCRLGHGEIKRLLEH